MHTRSAAYSVYCILCTASSQDRLSPILNQSLISWQIMLYSILYIFTSSSSPMNRVSASVSPPSHTSASRLGASKYFSNLAQLWPPSVSPNLLDYTLQVHTLMASKFIFRNLHNHGLPVCNIRSSKQISKLCRSQPTTLSPN
jgi:hypothetical protein